MHSLSHELLLVLRSVALAVRYEVVEWHEYSCRLRTRSVGLCYRLQFIVWHAGFIVAVVFHAAKAAVRECASMDSVSPESC